jgi:hypothetical protein
LYESESVEPASAFRTLRARRRCAERACYNLESNCTQASSANIVRRTTRGVPVLKTREARGTQSAGQDASAEIHRYRSREERRHDSAVCCQHVDVVAIVAEEQSRDKGAAGRLHEGAVLGEQLIGARLEGMEQAKWE